MHHPIEKPSKQSILIKLSNADFVRVFMSKSITVVKLSKPTTNVSAIIPCISSAIAKAITTASIFLVIPKQYFCDGEIYGATKQSS